MEKHFETLHITETLHISGMSCSHCVRAVQDALGEQPGVDVESVEIGVARVRFDPTVTSREDLESAIEEAGYEVTA